MEQFLKPELLGIGGALVLVFQVIWKVFSEAENLPAFPKWIVPLALIAAAFGLAGYERSIHPMDPASIKQLADAWFIQGAFLSGVMLTAWVTAVASFSSSTASAANPTVESKPSAMALNE